MLYIEGTLNSESVISRDHWKWWVLLNGHIFLIAQQNCTMQYTFLQNYIHFVLIGHFLYFKDVCHDLKVARDSFGLSTRQYFCINVNCCISRLVYTMKIIEMINNDNYQLEEGLLINLICNMQVSYVKYMEIERKLRN